MRSGCSWFLLGNPALAGTHMEQTIALYDPAQHHGLAYRYGGIDPGVGGFGVYAWALWMRGYPAQARAHSARALGLAQQLAHPFSLARTLHYDTILCQLRRDAPAARDQADAAITVATAQNFALARATGLIMRGWAIAVQEHSTEGLVQIRQGLDMYRSTGAEYQRPHYLTLLAEASGLLGQPEDGLAALDEALTLMEQTGERYYEAELHRQRGELLLLREAQSHPAQGSREQHDSRGVFSAGPRRGSSPAGEVPRTPRRHEPGPPVAAAGQARRSYVRCLPRSMAGSPRALTRRTCRRRRCCSRLWRNTMLADPP